MKRPVGPAPRLPASPSPPLGLGFPDCETRMFSSIQSLSRVRLFATPWTAARQASLSITNSRSLLKLMSIESVMPSNHLILCRPLLLLPSIFPSIRVFSNESAPRIRWPKYWSFSFSISPSNEYSGLVSFRMDWLDLLAVQGTLESLLQHSSSKASILREVGLPESKGPWLFQGPLGLGGLVPCVLQVELGHKTLLSFLRLSPPPPTNPLRLPHPNPPRAISPLPPSQHIHVQAELAPTPCPHHQVCRNAVNS